MSLLALALSVCSSTLLADSPAPETPSVVVTGHYDNALQSSTAASQGIIESGLLDSRALLRPAEILEFVPGMVVTQHSGDGKANQYFLRGMNLDHGTDFATTINGVPINLPTHAHGQGYSDVNVLIPELVSRVNYRKGPYFASEGDFSSAGSADIAYRTQLATPVASIALGQQGYVRGVAAGSTGITGEATLLTAVELMGNDGPWTVPESLRKVNALVTLSGERSLQQWSTSLSAYVARWTSTDQVPQRLIDAGSYQGQPFDGFDSLDPSAGGSTRRLSLSGNWKQTQDNQTAALQWYAVLYDLDLYSNFTYALERPIDQFAQTDRRAVVGGQALRTWTTELGPRLALLNTAGLQVRHDRIRVGLYDTAQRQVQGTVRDDRVQQSALGVYAQSQISWNGWLRTMAGVRADQLDVKVASAEQNQNSGRASAFKVSPKLSVIFGPWHKTELFLNAGNGFHSNDARGMTARIDPKTGLPINPVPGLVGSRGQELGIKTEWIPNLQSSLALWRLDFDSELVYVGDAGNTEAGRPSTRTGIEWSNHWMHGEHLLMDLDLAWTRPRYTGDDPAGNFISNATQRVANFTLALRDLGPWSGSLSFRYIGSAPLTESNSVRSSSSLTTNLRVTAELSESVTLTLDVLNLADRRNNDISYFYTSRVAGEPEDGVDGVHVHPAEPRTVRLTTKVKF